MVSGFGNHFSNYLQLGLLHGEQLGLHGEQLDSLHFGCMQRGCLQHGSHLGFEHLGGHCLAQGFGQGSHFFGLQGVQHLLVLQSLNQPHGSQKQSQKLLQPAKLRAPTTNRAEKANFKCFI